MTARTPVTCHLDVYTEVENPEDAQRFKEHIAGAVADFCEVYGVPDGIVREFNSHGEVEPEDD